MCYSQAQRPESNNNSSENSAPLKLSAGKHKVCIYVRDGQYLFTIKVSDTALGVLHIYYFSPKTIIDKIFPSADKSSEILDDTFLIMTPILNAIT